jgi:hypothetical protein
LLLFLLGLCLQSGFLSFLLPLLPLPFQPFLLDSPVKALSVP